MLPNGSSAPDFETTLHTGQRVRLSQLYESNHVILYFYPRDFTPGCAREACLFNESSAELASHGAVVLGISRDSPESHRRFAEAYKLPYLLGSDPDGFIARAYNALFLARFFLRITYVIERSGIIRMGAHHELFITHHLQDTLSVLRTLPTP